MPAGLYGTVNQGVVQWIDDSLLYSDTVEGFLSSLDWFLSAVEKKGVRLNIRKCEFLCETLSWCGRQISPKKWTFQPQYYQKILQTPRPRFAHQMAEALYLANWLSPTVPNIAYFRTRFRDIVSLSGKNMKVLRKKQIEIDWTDEMQGIWDSFLFHVHCASKQNLENYVPKRALVLLCDAS